VLLKLKIGLSALKVWSPYNGPENWLKLIQFYFTSQVKIFFRPFRPVGLNFEAPSGSG
jgi:hypothetical protein